MEMKAILSLSGGADSLTLLSYLLNDGYGVEPVWFSYGSKHNRHEQKAVQSIADHYKLRLHEIDLTEVMRGFKSNLLLSGGPIPEGHYAAPTMAQTVVPARNIIFLSILAGIACTLDIGEIAIAIHQGDHAIYPDCRPGFYEAMNRAVYEGTDGVVSIMAPFLAFDKNGIIQWGVKHGVPYQLSRTCYKDQELSCGKCGACTERLEAFTSAGATDPISYE